MKGKKDKKFLHLKMARIEFLIFLQSFVDDEYWKKVPRLVSHICDAYILLVQGEDEDFGANFGSPEFWSAALGNKIFFSFKKFIFSVLFLGEEEYENETEEQQVLNPWESSLSDSLLEEMEIDIEGENSFEEMPLQIGIYSFFVGYIFHLFF